MGYVKQESATRVTLQSISVGMPEEMWGPPDFLNKTEIDESIKNIG